MPSIVPETIMDRTGTGMAMWIVAECRIALAVSIDDGAGDAIRRTARLASVEPV